MTKAILIDTEVNSLEHKETIELAFADYEIGSVGDVYVYRYQPTEPIDAGAAVVHGILDCDLVGKPPACAAVQAYPSVEYFIGHNVDFDWEVLGSPSDVRRICTLALARWLWPQYGSHKLTALMYERFGMTADTRERIDGAHGAGVDVKILADILAEIVAALGVTDLAALWSASEQARIPTVMPFGKHKGVAMDDVPRDYKSWLLRQSDVDPYLRTALEL